MMHGSLPAKLQVLRARQGLTLIEAAEKIGIGRDTLSDLERGNRHPVMPTLAKIAQGYGVPVEDLLEEPVLAGKADAPREAGRLLDLPQVQDWLQEQEAKFVPMPREEFSDLVVEIQDLEDLEDLAKEIAEERRRVEEELSKPAVRKALFPPDMRGLTTKKAREHEAMRPARDALKLRPQISHEYLIKELALSNYSMRLYAEGEASDFLIHPRQSATMPEATRRRLEEARRKAFREALAGVAA
jgi:transcriptional regulator with XRE-family HTH domain